MRFPIRIHRRWLRRVALGLTVAAVVAPAAQAYDYHQPFDTSLDTASLPCTPSCSFEVGAPTIAQPPVERAHPRGGLIVGAASSSAELAGRRAGPAAGPQAAPSPFTHFNRHPGSRIIAGAGAGSTGGTSVDWPAVGAGVGMGTAFAFVLAGLAAMLGRRRSRVTHA